MGAVDWRLVVTVVGWCGTVGLLLGYALVSVGRLPGDGRGYQVVNVLGSIALGLAAFAGRVWPSVALNGVWVLIGLAALARLRRRGSVGRAPADRGRHGDPAPVLCRAAVPEPELSQR